MTQLQFLAAIKWPVTVLLLALLATVALKRSPGARNAMGSWLRERDVRVNIAGQEIEATRTATQASMDLAADSDTELAEVVTEPKPSDEDEQPQRSGPTLEAIKLEIARRAVVENVALNAIRLGWEWGRTHDAAPELSVEWIEGSPSLHVREPASGPDGNSRVVVSAPRRSVSADKALLAMRTFLAAFANHSAEIVAQQDALRDAVRLGMQARDVDGEGGIEPGETQRG